MPWWQILLIVIASVLLAPFSINNKREKCKDCNKYLTADFYCKCTSPKE